VVNWPSLVVPSLKQNQVRACTALQVTHRVHTPDPCSVLPQAEARGLCGSLPCVDSVSNPVPVHPRGLSTTS
jgi:hypothetical protein